MTPNSRLHWRSILAFMTFAGVVVLGIYIAVAHHPFGLDIGENALMDWVRALGPWGGIGIVALMVAHSFIPFPAEIVAFLSGEIFGLVRGTLYAWTGAMLGASLAFWLARLLGREAVMAMLPKASAKQLAQWSASSSTNVLFLARFIPVIAFNLVNYAAGLTQVRWWTFLWTTGIGILPLTIFFVYLGQRMRSATWLEWLVTALSALALWGAAHLIAFLVRRRRRRSAD